MVHSTDIVTHLTIEQLDAGLGDIRRSPVDGGTLHMIVRRPDVDRREVVDEGSLDVEVGLVGDTWNVRESRSTPDGSPNPEAQVTIINSRALDLMAQSEDRWPLSGDQLVIDIDMSKENLPPGTRLSIGSAVIEISEKPHTGCVKFADRFGKAALRFVSTPLAMDMRLRGVNTRVVQSGTIRPGDTVTKIAPQPAL